MNTSYYKDKNGKLTHIVISLDLKKHPQFVRPIDKARDNLENSLKRMVYRAEVERDTENACKRYLDQLQDIGVISESEKNEAFDDGKCFFNPEIDHDHDVIIEKFMEDLNEFLEWDLIDLFEFESVNIP